MRAIADTGFLVAFANRRDRHHEWALGFASQVSEPLLTCEAVLAESAFHLQNASLVLALVSQGLVTPEFDVFEQLPRLTQLAGRYADRKPDFADLCLIRLSEMHPKLRVLTVDVEDFRIYRRNRNEMIPLIVPPGLH
jgi:uncharacterized protein